MTYKNKLFSSLNATRSNASDVSNDLSDLMSNPDYLRYSSTIINDALKEGFDVLQLPNGDIVTTGTKVITNTYVWDAQKSMLTKARTPTKMTRGRKAKADVDAEMVEEDATNE